MSLQGFNKWLEDRLIKSQNNYANAKNYYIQNPNQGNNALIGHFETEMNLLTEVLFKLKDYDENRNKKN